MKTDNEQIMGKLFPIMINFLLISNLSGFLKTYTLLLLPYRTMRENLNVFKTLGYLSSVLISSYLWHAKVCNIFNLYCVKPYFRDVLHNFYAP